MKHTGQESGAELCEIFKCRSFLQSKQCLQTASAYGELCPPDPTPGLSPRPTGDLSPNPWVIVPQMKIPGATNNYDRQSTHISTWPNHFVTIQRVPQNLATFMFTIT